MPLLATAKFVVFADFTLTFQASSASSGLAMISARTFSLTRQRSENFILYLLVGHKTSCLLAQSASECQIVSYINIKVGAPYTIYIDIVDVCFYAV